MDEPASNDSNHRATWASLPEAVRDRAEASLGARVVQATTQPGGFTPGVAAVMDLSDGSSVFLKALEINGHSNLVESYRNEAHIAPQLPPTVPAPGFRFTFEADSWCVLAFDAISGRLPSLPWIDSDLQLTMRLLEDLATQLTPSPVPHVRTIAQAYGSEFTTWRRLAEHGNAGQFMFQDLAPKHQAEIGILAELESRWEDAAAGQTLLHLDLRADNLVIDDQQKMWLVDWSAPCLGAQWIDLATFLPTIRRPTQQLEKLLSDHPTASGVDPKAINSFLVALGGTWLERAAEDPVSNAPGLRAMQAASGAATMDWVAQRSRV